jgi:hypothetical protein
MANQSNSTHGAPSWLQHSSSDPAAARKFYETVLGWTVSEMPMKNGSNYPAIVVGDKPVGGFSPMPGSGGWLTFITVDDVLLIQRDCTLANWQRDHPDRGVLDDEELEIISSTSIDIDRQIADVARARRLAARSLRRRNGSGRRLGAVDARERDVTRPRAPQPGKLLTRRLHVVTADHNPKSKSGARS